MSDDERIAEIETRANAATPGPWNVTEMEGHWLEGAGYVQGMTYYVFEAEQRGDGECGSMLKEDAEFVAASREDVPWLLDRLTEARAALARAAARTAGLVEAAFELSLWATAVRADGLNVCHACQSSWRSLERHGEGCPVGVVRAIAHASGEGEP
jgi:hypothetical protein